MTPNNHPGHLCILSAGRNEIEAPCLRSATALAIAMVEANIGLICLANAGGWVVQIARIVRQQGGHVTCIATAGMHTNHALLALASGKLKANDLHACKMLLFHRSDALVVIPDGVGILDILMEYLTWMPRLYGAKPVYILDTGDTWRLLSKVFKQMHHQLFLPAHFDDRYILLDPQNFHLILGHAN